MNLKSYAKINLSLIVLEKLEDGYHKLRSVMHNINLYDELSFEIIPEDNIIIECNIKELENENNICYKAAFILKSRFFIDEGIKINIKKNIPIGAGLAGGSGNAAATLIAMNKLLNLNLSKDELLDIGRELGSDVPFQILSGTALVEGTGEILTKLNDISLNVLLINPGIEISTKEAYQELDIFKKEKIFEDNRLLEGIKKNDTATITKNLHNDFEDVIFKGFPEIKGIKEELIENGAMNALMSGSGSTVFGIFEDNEKLEKAYNNLKENYSLVIRCR